ncbi:IMPACT family protein [Pseudomonas sp. BMS12]|uniref:IMPACT family protein n=1 Tax=Pseudomonas sp. BMS12 TaxID=1796033 RepID=UPI00083A02E3|nr:YigZ family protein [Pseudomonas sp. BMS12]
MPFTLQAPCEYREEIRKSRFLALAAPVASTGEALDFIERHSDRSASHNCWAFKCGNQYRFSDDGEPGGTAGRPILAAIEGQDCDQVVVLVIRWYGGIQLGTGGLARAYGGSAARCLQGGSAMELVEHIRVRCHVPFTELARIQSYLSTWQALLEQKTFDANGAWLELAVPTAKLDLAKCQLSDLGRGRISLEPISETEHIATDRHT